MAIVGGGPGGLVTAHALERDARSPFDRRLPRARRRRHEGRVSELATIGLRWLTF